METIKKWARQFEGTAAAGLSEPGHVEAYGPAVASMGQGVDVCPYHVDGPGNAEFHVQDIDAFLNDGALGLDPEATFVVMSYVPVPDDTVRGCCL